MFAGSIYRASRSHRPLGYIDTLPADAGHSPSNCTVSNTVENIGTPTLRNVITVLKTPISFFEEPVPCGQTPQNLRNMPKFRLACG
jgi:hypothetical protein